MGIFCKLLLLLFINFLNGVDGFQPPNSLFSVKSIAKGSSTVLYRAFHKKNKQAELLKKLNDAKKERENREGTDVSVDASSNVSARVSDKEMKEANDMKRFEQMLNSDSATINYELDGTGTNYLTKEQEEDDIDASFRRVDRIFEGDPAPTAPFKDLVSVKTDLALGENGTKNVVPWLNKNPSKHNDYLVIITDPRTKSLQLQELMNVVSTRMSNDILNKIVVINSDATSVSRKWLKKHKITNLAVYSDEKLDWMREYTALGEKRWAICMFIIADGRVQKLVRELDANVAEKVIQSAINSLVN